MCKDTIIPNWTKWLAGLALLAIALAAGTLGLVLNVSHGLEAGLAAGVAFGLADGAKVLIPLTAGMIGWSRQMKITAAVCVAVSLWSAVNVYLDGAGSAFLAKQQGAEAYGPPWRRLRPRTRAAGRTARPSTIRLRRPASSSRTPARRGRTRSPSRSPDSRG